MKHFESTTARNISFLISVLLHLSLFMYIYYHHEPVKNMTETPPITVAYMPLPENERWGKVSSDKIDKLTRSIPKKPSHEKTFSDTPPAMPLSPVTPVEKLPPVVDDAGIAKKQNTPDIPSKALPGIKDLIPPLDRMAKLDKEKEVVKDEVANCDDMRFTSYCYGFLNKLNSILKYPEAALKDRITGWGRVRITVSEDGYVEASIIQSSGHPILDEAVINTIQKASPFNPFMENMGATKLSEVYYFVFGFQIKDRWVIQ